MFKYLPNIYYYKVVKYMPSVYVGFVPRTCLEIGAKTGATEAGECDIVPHLTFYRVTPETIGNFLEYSRLFDVNGQHALVALKSCAADRLQPLDTKVPEFAYATASINPDEMVEIKPSWLKELTKL